MVRVGIVQLDTSHCEYFTPVVNDFEDLKVTAVWDDGWVRAPGYAEEFAREFGVEKVCASLDELVDSVDVGMLFGQNWDLHLEQARAFLEAGKRVFIDKPVVGSMRDVVALRELSERTGVPVMGGSSLRYAPELTPLRERREELGQIVSAFASGPQDFFNYGVHAVAMVAGFFGPGVEAVRYITGETTDIGETRPDQLGRVARSAGPPQIVLLEQRDGPPIVLQLAAPDGWDYSFFLALTTDHGVEPLIIKSDEAWGVALVEGQAADFSRYAHGEEPSVPLAGMLEEVTVCLAAAEARRTGRRVALDDIPLEAGFDGAAFTRAYAEGGGWHHAAGGGTTQPSSTYLPPPEVSVISDA